MSTPNNNNSDRSMLWMGAAMVACCAVPIVIALSLGGGLGAFFGSANRSTDRTGNPASTQTNPVSGASPTDTTSQVDKQFIAMMVPHHERASKQFRWQIWL